MKNILWVMWMVVALSVDAGTPEVAIPVGALRHTKGLATNLTANGLKLTGPTTNALATASRVLVYDAAGRITNGPTTAAEVAFVNGVTSAIQTQLDGKQASLGFTPVNKAGDTGIGTLGLSSGSSLNWNGDTYLVRSAADVLALRNSTTAQEFLTTGTYTDSTHYEQLSIKHYGSSSGIVFDSQKGSAGGTARNYHFKFGGVATGLYLSSQSQASSLGSAYIGNSLAVDEDGSSSIVRCYAGTVDGQAAVNSSNYGYVQMICRPGGTYGFQAVQKGTFAGGNGLTLSVARDSTSSAITLIDGGAANADTTFRCYPTSSGTGAFIFQMPTTGGFQWQGGVGTKIDTPCWSFHSDFNGVSTTSGTSVGLHNRVDFTPASGNAEFRNLNLYSIINQTGGANGNATLVYVDCGKTALGGTLTLMDLKVDGTSKFKVAEAGDVTMHDLSVHDITISGTIAGLTLSGNFDTNFTVIGGTNVHLAVGLNTTNQQLSGTSLADNLLATSISNSAAPIALTGTFTGGTIAANNYSNAVFVGSQVYATNGITYAAVIYPDMGTGAATIQGCVLTGDVEINTTNRNAFVKTVTIELLASGADRALTFNPSWVWFSVPPVTLLSGKRAKLTLESWSSAETGIRAVYVAQP